MDAKLKLMDEQKRQLEQEQEVKHYYHKKLLDTLDLGVLSQLQEERGRVWFRPLRAATR